MMWDSSFGSYVPTPGAAVVVICEVGRAKRSVVEANDAWFGAGRADASPKSRRFASTARSCASLLSSDDAGSV